MCTTFDYNDFIDASQDIEIVVTCKYCNVAGFEWRKTEQGWRLFDKNNNVHECWRTNESTS